VSDTADGEVFRDIVLAIFADGDESKKLDELIDSFVDVLCENTRHDRHSAELALADLRRDVHDLFKDYCLIDRRDTAEAITVIFEPAVGNPPDSPPPPPDDTARDSAEAPPAIH
jgi:hypothetical protein